MFSLQDGGGGGGGGGQRLISDSVLESQALSLPFSDLADVRSPL